MRCALCGGEIEIDDGDAVAVHGGGLAHESCLDEYDGDVEASAAEIERERHERRKRRRTA